jgi:nonribosomal peptide synthetase protein VioO
MPHVVERITEAGELLIGGPALALGYLGAPHTTEARFQTLDLGDGPRRYFLTGDRVVRGPAGELLHRGRLDGQIKVRGIRVDPSEVEAAIAGHGGVAAVAVVGVTVADHTTMVAYVVPRPAAIAETLAADILGYLRQRVPAHLVPSQLTVVPELIRTPSGKVDRAASHMRHVSRTRGRRSVDEC